MLVVCLQHASDATMCPPCLTVVNDSKVCAGCKHVEGAGWVMEHNGPMWWKLGGVEWIGGPKLGPILLELVV